MWHVRLVGDVRCALPPLLQALLAAVGAGPGSGSGELGAAQLAAAWQDNCGALLEVFVSAVVSAVEVSPSAALQQLERQGVWRLLEQLVDATSGALLGAGECPACSMCTAACRGW